MSSCDLRIVFDHESRHFQPGDPVTGRVLVAADREMSVRLTLERSWRTHGRGNKASGDAIKSTIFEGRWLPGDRHEYEFEFDAPQEPFTYRGHYLNVDWYLMARAEVSWKIDPRTEEEFFLAPPAEPAEIEPEPTERAGASKKGMLFLALFGVPFLLAGVLTLVAGVAHLFGATTIQGTWWVTLIIGPIFTLVGGGLILDALRNMLAQRSRLLLNGATATLRGVEEAVSGSGTNRTTHTHELHETTIDLLPPGEHLPVDNVEASATMTVPLDAPCTFTATDNEIKWFVAIVIDRPGWPDWSRRFPLEVVP